MKYVRTKDGIHRVLDENELVYSTRDENFYKCDVRVSDNLAELCDCFIIKFVESKGYSAYDTYEDARWVYDHDKQNTTCILYGAIETETGLKFVAIETFNGLVRIEE